jgi:hypothetical protein
MTEDAGTCSTDGWMAFFCVITTGQVQFEDLLNIMGVKIMMDIADVEGKAASWMIKADATGVKGLRMPADPAAMSGNRVVASCGPTLARLPR